MDVYQMSDRHIKSFKRLQDNIDAHKAKASSIALRKHWLEKQKLNIYINEYDRIRGLLNQAVVKRGNVEGLQNRKKVLEALGAKAVYSIV